jgi:general secretion pathway protein C
MARNLFNTASPPEKPEAGPVLGIAAMEQTTLDLRLWGTVVTSRGRGDYAIIEDRKRRKQELYRTGDPLQNAVVKAVLREKVVLNVGGKDEILAMEEATGAPAAPAGRRAAPRRPPIERNLPVDRSAVSEAMENIGDLMKTVRIRPHFEKGQPAGLRLAGVRPNSVVRKLGLRSGDILQAVDGAPVRSVDDVVNLYSKLTSQDDLTLQIKRRGRVQNLRFQMK